MMAQLAVTDVGEGFSSRRASKETIWLHWLSAGSVAALVALGFGHSLVSDLDARRLVMDLHRTLGLLVGAATLARLVLTLRDRHASAAEAVSGLQALAAKASHGLLYLTLVAMPVVGLFQASAAKPHPALFGVIPLPRLIAYDSDLGDTLAEWHERLAWVLIALVGLHALAALWHHYVRRDDTLTAIAPWLRRRATSGS